MLRFRKLDRRNNELIEDPASGVGQGSRVWLRPNKYDPDRAHMAVANWSRRPAVDVDLGTFLDTGDRFRVQDALDYFGPPVAQSTYQGGAVAIPVRVSEATGDGEFGAYVILRDHKPVR